jgi:quercetin dioxygenase-like cupin family protein
MTRRAAGVVPSSDFVFAAADSAIAEGLEVAVMAGAAQDAIHLEVALARLDAGGSVRGHRHFYEESFYLLEGEALVSIDGYVFHLTTNDFGFVPAGVPHAWANRSDSPAIWFRMRSPQPREIAGTEGTFPSAAVAIPESGTLVGDPHPTIPYVGHFADHHLPAPGPIAMRGYRGPNVKNVAIWMLVDEFIGAVHQTLFIVQFLPGSTTHPMGDHFHPFEEAYYFLSGSAIAYLEGEELEVNTGDLVFAGTNAMHGYQMTSHEPVRWIEVQAPAPTGRGAFVFPSQWETLPPTSRG